MPFNLQGWDNLVLQRIASSLQDSWGGANDPLSPDRCRKRTSVRIAT